MDIDKAKKIQAIVTLALTTAREHVSDGAVNWARVSCIDIEASLLYPDDGCTVIVCPADPQSTELIGYVNGVLRANNIDNISTRCEW